MKRWIDPDLVLIWMVDIKSVTHRQSINQTQWLTCLDLERLAPLKTGWRLGEYLGSTKYRLAHWKLEVNLFFWCESKKITPWWFVPLCHTVWRSNFIAVYCNQTEKIPNLLSGHRKGPRPSTNTTSMYKTREIHVTKTHSLTYCLKYIDSCTDILY